METRTIGPIVRPSKQPIGIATISFDNSGKAKSASFEPTLKTVSSQEVLDSLKTVKGKDPKTTKDNADMVMSEWFSKVNEIELADREQYEIVSEVLHCDTNGKGLAKTIKVAFFFQSRS